MEPAGACNLSHRSVHVYCEQSLRDPFRLGFAYTDELDAAPMIMGLAVATGFYSNITGDRQFDEFGSQQVLEFPIFGSC
jgi:hypothetical protein